MGKYDSRWLANSHSCWYTARMGLWGRIYNNCNSTIYSDTVYSPLVKVIFYRWSVSLLHGSLQHLRLKQWYPIFHCSVWISLLRLIAMATRQFSHVILINVLAGQKNKMADNNREENTSDSTWIMENKPSLPLSTGISLGVRGKKLSTKRADKVSISNAHVRNTRKGMNYL